ncbi:MAG: DUF2911 domain-containing protein [Acidobacteria bacterium]|nr:DUF2911 domain-containing protein [Acidobacteriota bacterium]MBV9625451.1 DUF2911 domain-containing protein [Acidobacteriota bacterium]
MRTLSSLAALMIIAGANVLAEDAQSTYCTFDDNNDVTMQYYSRPKETPRNGRVWSPGITLYVQTPLVLGNSEIGLGAYSVHLIPDRKNWTIIVNKGVTAGASYNPAQDVARAPMEIGEIPDPVDILQLAFAHLAAKKCGLRVYYQKVGAFVDFAEK